MAQKFLSIKNFEKYQSSTPGKTRTWIKLHKAILGDPEFVKLSTPYRFVYMALLLIADDCNNKIVNDPEYLLRRLYISPTDPIHLDTKVIQNLYADVQNLYRRHTELDLKALYRSGFIITTNLSRVLSELDRTREELELDRESSGADAPTLPPVVVIHEKKRPIPLPDDFKFTAELREWALAKGCKEPFAEFERFCSKATSKGWTYVNWTKAYQNWVLNELKWARERSHA